MVLMGGSCGLRTAILTFHLRGELALSRPRLEPLLAPVRQARPILGLHELGTLRSLSATAFASRSLTSCSPEQQLCFRMGLGKRSRTVESVLELQGSGLAVTGQTSLCG